MRQRRFVLAVFLVVGVAGGFAWVAWSQQEPRDARGQIVGYGCPNNRCDREIGENYNDCPQDCNPRCSNGVKEGPEECDDGNLINEDGCSIICKREFCGDNVWQSRLGEECDSGPGNGSPNSPAGPVGGYYCDTGCKLQLITGLCGNGAYDPTEPHNEECDDANNTSGDGCSADCKIEFCGDGIVNDRHEECDDGNTVSGDGCNALCKREASSSSSSSSSSKAQCDDGRDNDTDTYTDDKDWGCYMSGASFPPNMNFDAITYDEDDDDETFDPKVDTPTYEQLVIEKKANEISQRPAVPSRNTWIGSLLALLYRTQPPPVQADIRQCAQDGGVYRSLRFTYAPGATSGDRTPLQPIYGCVKIKIDTRLEETDVQPHADTGDTRAVAIDCQDKCGYKPSRNPKNATTTTKEWCAAHCICHSIHQAGKKELEKRNTQGMSAEKKSWDDQEATRRTQLGELNAQAAAATGAERDRLMAAYANAQRAFDAFLQQKKEHFEKLEKEKTENDKKIADIDSGQHQRQASDCYVQCMNGVDGDGTQTRRQGGPFAGDPYEKMCPAQAPDCCRAVCVMDHCPITVVNKTATPPPPIMNTPAPPGGTGGGNVGGGGNQGGSASSDGSDTEEDGGEDGGGDEEGGEGGDDGGGEADSGGGVTGGTTGMTPASRPPVASAMSFGSLPAECGIQTVATGMRSPISIVAHGNRVWFLWMEQDMDKFYKITSYGVSYVEGTTVREAASWPYPEDGSQVPWTLNRYPPTDIHPGPDGSVWVTGQPNNPAIRKVRPDGTMDIFQLSNHNNTTSVNAQTLFNIFASGGPEYDLWFSEGLKKQILRMRKDGSVQAFDLPANTSPWDIAVDGQGTLRMGVQLGDPAATGVRYQLATMNQDGVFALLPPKVRLYNFAESAGPGGGVWYAGLREEPRTFVAGVIDTAGGVTEYEVRAPVNPPQGQMSGGLQRFLVGQERTLWDLYNPGSMTVSRLTVEGSTVVRPAKTFLQLDSSHHLWDIATDGASVWVADDRDEYKAPGANALLRITCNPASSASSLVTSASVGSVGPSARSSSRSSSRSSVSPGGSGQSSSRVAQDSSRSPNPLCAQDGCTQLGGNPQCAARNAVCRRSEQLPCYVCDVSSLSQRSTSAVSAPAGCGADPCRTGGQSYCSGFGLLCRTVSTALCYECYAPARSTVSVASFASVATLTRSSLAVTYVPPAQSSRSSVPSRSVTNVYIDSPMARSSFAPPSPPSSEQPPSPQQPSSRPPLAVSPRRPLPSNVLADRSLCGNGMQEPGEECDDKNSRDFDGCSADCLLERGRCGDGIVQTLLNEQCEPSAHDASLPYGCSQNCRFASSLCGNGTVDDGEQCDQGPANSNAQNAFCRLDCSFARCGDNIVDSRQGEQCDDGNRIGSDGCNERCTLERTAPSPLAAQVFTLPQAPGFPQSPVQTGPAGQGYTAQAWQVLPQTTVPVTAASGPGALMVMAGGAAAGVGYMRRRRKT